MTLARCPRPEAALLCGLWNQASVVNLVSDCVSATGFDGHLHRLACDTQASLFCESEPPLRVAHMPLPKSSVARLSPSIILVNSKLCVRVAGV